ncbi:DUF382-domain-containing protein [Pseudovirgaria hyperparasitica]|uniref:DUF382-domain-containing protein n=1 Tax=Pseudovirgaria hyperparasitica TaxID=470096 RepID=A0A6A6W3J6_9PEZI|nr:DUF382-domain-containing protein [Pseudovirgaria hyperparasitica]KAF2755611.1 DUF382-domain-containing protein [Pseudovirgaria hyperparasitica]
MSGTKKKENKNHKRRAAQKAKKDASYISKSYIVRTSANIRVAQASLRAESEAPIPQSVRGDSPSPDPADVDEKHSAAVSFEIDPSDPLYAQFKSVFQRLEQPEAEATKEPAKAEIYYDGDDDIPDEEDESAKKLSKRARKQQNMLSIAELKAIVKKPELVEWTDVNAPDPRLLVSIKGHRNVVPVPQHWALKREYLSSKRGVEKPAFSLPKFIQETGIAEMRDALLEKQAEQTMKQKQRERVAPKMGRLDIDYGKLYEAFFKFQTKPELTRYGEVYYEGKEYETNLRHLRPGELSEELKDALNIPPGAPPPWLINQQRFGPPPSYPALKIAGLNAPPPPGAQWGFHPGGYGKPPVDEFNRPLYGGDIFGTAILQQPQQTGEPVEKTLWGELQPPEESEEEEEEEDDDADEDVDMSDGDIPDTTRAESPAPIPVPQIRDERIASDFSIGKGGRRGSADAGPPRELYQVVQEQNVRSKGFFGSDRTYDIKATQRDPDVPMLGRDSGRKRKAGDVDVSVDVDALADGGKLSKEELQRQYDAQRKADAAGAWGGGGIDQDDLSQMIADESRKRLKKDEEKRGRR